MRKTILAAVVLLSACQRQPEVAAPTAAEAEQLDNAEADLNALGNDEGPASGDADPSSNR